MIILHVAQTEMGFLLWGESPSVSSTSSVSSSAASAASENGEPALSPKRTAKKKIEHSAISPFDAGLAALDATLVEHLGLSPRDAYPLEGTAWLPSSKSAPYHRVGSFTM